MFKSRGKKRSFRKRTRVPSSLADSNGGNSSREGVGTDADDSKGQDDRESAAVVDAIRAVKEIRGVRGRVRGIAAVSGGLGLRDNNGLARDDGKKRRKSEALDSDKNAHVDFSMVGATKFSASRRNDVLVDNNPRMMAYVQSRLEGSSGAEKKAEKCPQDRNSNASMNHPRENAQDEDGPAASVSWNAALTEVELPEEDKRKNIEATEKAILARLQNNRVMGASSLSDLEKFRFAHQRSSSTSGRDNCPERPYTGKRKMTNEGRVYAKFVKKAKREADGGILHKVVKHNAHINQNVYKD